MRELKAILKMELNFKYMNWNKMSSRVKIIKIREMIQVWSDIWLELIHDYI